MNYELNELPMHTTHLEWVKAQANNYLMANDDWPHAHRVHSGGAPISALELTTEED